MGTSIVECRCFWDFILHMQQEYRLFMIWMIFSIFWKCMYCLVCRKTSTTLLSSMRIILMFGLFWGMRRPSPTTFTVRPTSSSYHLFSSPAVSPRSVYYFSPTHQNMNLSSAFAYSTLFKETGKLCASLCLLHNWDKHF